jgi:uncharacterized protein (TIGR03086 family)
MDFDHTPSAQRLADLVSNVPEDALGDPTPCDDYTVGDLLDHIGGLALAFTEAAEKSGDPNAEPPPPGDVTKLPDDWRRRIPDQLGTLGEAWQDPDAWTGMSRAGGIEMPAEVAAVVALEEVVVHGWDLARATGQPYSASDAELEVVAGFFGMFSEDDRSFGYGPAVAVGDDAAPLDRIVAQSGRDPGWSAG